MKKRKFRSQTNALSIMHDTLLFLVFLSISAMIVSPIVLHSSSFDSTTDYLTEKKVQESLQTILSTTIHNFSYQTGSSLIDPFTKNFGINTESTEGIIGLMTHHVLGKQQYHKTLAQLLTEQLASQYKIAIKNETVWLNPFAQDAYKQLYHVLKDTLQEILPSNLNYHFSAHWQPLHTVSFGGNITIGSHIPKSVTTYSINYQLSMPLLPCINFNDTLYCCSSFHLKNRLDALVNNTSSLQNILFLQNQHMSKENKSILINQNMSSFLKHIIITGFYTKNDQLLFPSILDVLFHSLFSTVSHTFTPHYHSLPSFSGFKSITSFLESFHPIDSTEDIPDITTLLLTRLTQSMSTIGEDLTWSTFSDVTAFIKQQIIQTLKPFIQTLGYDCSIILLNQESFLSNIDDIIDTVFSYLSFSTATVSLTVWRG